MYVGDKMRHVVSVKVGGQLVRVGSCLPPGGTQEWNLGCQTRQQILLPTKSSHQPEKVLFAVGSGVEWY